MRILAIRGRNLASLSEPFEIDLKASPLADVGLFAITGETGAGKSTILDALCLALYGTYPRTSVGSNEGILDSDGATLTAKDARNVLRGGVAAGFAEVDFTAQDGIDYRARWEVARARSRYDGKLQAVRRSLLRLDDGSGVASGIKPVLEKVKELTGLSYDQFRRTALLAQGEFDAFLLASEKDRAELLEKLTGADIYARISTAVHSLNKEREQNVATLELRMGEVRTMPPEVRAETETAVEKAQKSVKDLEAELAKLDNELRRLETIESARAKVVGARTLLAASQAALDADPGFIATARLARQLAPFSSQYEGIECAKADLADASAEIEALNGTREQLAAQKSALVERLQSAQRAVDGAKAEIKRFEPVWQGATKLDIELGLAEAQLSMATAGRLDAEKELAQFDEDLLKLAPMPANGWPALQITITADLAAARDKQQELAEQRDSLRAEMDAFDEPSVRERAVVFAGLKSRIETAANLARDTFSAIGRSEKLTADAETLRRDEAADKALLDNSEAALAIAKAALEASQVLGRVADLAREARAHHMRAELVPGEACPVCGALEHPFAADPEALELAAQLAAKRDAAAQAEAKARANYSAALETHAKANATRKAAEASASEQITAVAKQRTALSNELEQLGARLKLADIAIAFATADPVEAEALLDTASGRLDAAWKEVDAKLGEFAKLSDRARAIDKDLDATARKIRELDALDRKLVQRGPLVASVDKSNDEVRARQSRCDGLREERAGLLDGEPTEAHKSRISASLQDTETAVATAREEVAKLEISERELAGKEAETSGAFATLQNQIQQQQSRLLADLANSLIPQSDAFDMLRQPEAARLDLVVRLDKLEATASEAAQQLERLQRDLDELTSGAAPPSETEQAGVRQQRQANSVQRDAAVGEVARLKQQLDDEQATRKRLGDLERQLEDARSIRQVWSEVHDAIGSEKGDKFRRFAQGVTLEHLIALANHHLEALNPRYRLRRSMLTDLNFDVVDREMGDEARSPRSLSGGERFLVSLALALALAGLEGRQAFVDTLFIDEGFGALDRETLDVAIDALETLNSQGRQVGVITHVAAMIERIPVQIRVEKRGGGRSVVRLANAFAEPVS